MRAWVIYFTQIGDHAVEPGDTEPERALLTNRNLLAFSGQTASRDRTTVHHARLLADSPHVGLRTSPGG